MSQVFWILWFLGVAVVVGLRLIVLGKHQALLSQAGGNPLRAYRLLSARSSSVSIVFLFVAIGRAVLVVAPLLFLAFSDLFK
jgi:hypothetical protein